MNGVRLHKDRFSRGSRTCMLTCAAADAILVIYFWNGQFAVRHHPHGFRRTMLGTGAAIVLLCFNDTILFYKMGFADLQYFLFLGQDRLNRAGGAYLTAQRAIEIAIADGIIHPRLHNAGNAELKKRRLQHMRRASTDAEMARCTMACELVDTAPAGRHHGCSSSFLVRRSCGGGRLLRREEPQHPRRRCGKNASPCVVNRRLRRLLSFLEGVFHSDRGAGTEAIETSDARREIDLPFLAVDTPGTANAFAQPTIDAVLVVYCDAKY